MLQLLKEAIEKEGIGIGDDIVKVDCFLNHRIDSRLSTAMGQAFYEAFKDDKPDLILTVEASGIAVAVTTAQAFGFLPLVFAKKGDHRNVGSDVYTAPVYSFTHQTQNTIRVSRKYLPAGSRVLIVDDFLANGEAIRGMKKIVEEAGCTVVGAGVCIEKGFQPGGKELREEGLKLISLAVVDAIHDGQLVVRED